MQVQSCEGTTGRPRVRGPGGAVMTPAVPSPARSHVSLGGHSTARHVSQHFRRLFHPVRQPVWRLCPPPCPHGARWDAILQTLCPPPLSPPPVSPQPRPRGYFRRELAGVAAPLQVRDTDTPHAGRTGRGGD